MRNSRGSTFAKLMLSIRGRAPRSGMAFSAGELIGRSERDPSSSESHPRPPKSDGTDYASGKGQITLPTTPPLSDRDLRSWYEKRVSELMACDKAASGEADWEAAK